MAKIQDIFKDLLKNSLAPRLRESGLKGSGQNYSLASDSHWALIGFQKSVYSDSTCIKFTINLYVVSKSEWEIAREERSYLPANPSANVHWPVGWVKRIGELMPQRQDFWWSMDSTTDLQALVADVVENIRSRAVPAMREKIMDT